MMSSEEQKQYQDVQGIKLTQPEEEIKLLIEGEPIDAPIFKIYEAFRDQVEGNIEIKNQILTRRVYEFFMKKPEKWTAEDHYEQRRDLNSASGSIDDKRVLLFGTDFFSSKQLRKTLKEKFNLMLEIQIVKLDNSHLLLTFKNKEESIRFLEKTKDSEFLHTTTNQLSINWHPLWKYQYYSKKRNIEARFCLKEEQFPKVSGNLRYEKAKQQMLLQFNNYEGKEALEADVAAIAFGEQQQRNRKGHDQNINSNWSEKQEQPFRSREKRNRQINRSNSSNKSNSSDHKYIVDRFLDRKFEAINRSRANIHHSMTINSEKTTANKVNTNNTCFLLPQEQINQLTTRKPIQSEHKQQQYSNPKNNVNIRKVHPETLNQQAKKRSLQKHNDPSTIDYKGVCLDDLSDFDNYSGEEYSNLQAVRKVSEDDEQNSELSLILPNNEQHLHTAKELDLSNFQMYEEYQKCQNLEQNADQPSKISFSKRLQMFEQQSQKVGRRQLFEKPLHQLQKDERELREQSSVKRISQPKQKSSKNKYSNFSYLEYYAQTQQNQGTNKFEIIVDLTED